MKILWTLIILNVIQPFTLVTCKYQLSSHKHMDIVGGKLADIRNYPFTVCLAKKYKTISEFAGGAVIISKYWALTAAHCIVGHFSEDTLRLKTGYVRGNTSFWKRDYIEHPMERLVVHEQYDNRGFDDYDYDIALVKVSVPFNGANEKIIGLSHKNKIHVGNRAIVLGWGAISKHYFYTTRQLRVVDVEIRSRRTCKKRYTELEHKIITNRMVCALLPRKDACMGDSGGPLVLENTLIGLVSWGPKKDCAHKTLPGVYTRVSYFYDWVRNKIAEKRHRARKIPLKGTHKLPSNKKRKKNPSKSNTRIQKETQKGQTKRIQKKTRNKIKKKTYKKKPKRMHKKQNRVVQFGNYMNA